ncbi:MAG: DUF1289 domain-containing protein [Nevskiaceae bacterium]
MSFTGPHQRSRPMSPCISVCALDASGHCAGCLRTRDEIARWIRLSPDEQWALLSELDQRRAARQLRSRSSGG